MTTTFTCARGHQWEARADGPAASRCPICHPAADANNDRTLGDRTASAPPAADATTVGLEAADFAEVAPPAIAGYEVLGELGRGGMGVVYKARQFNLNRLVALKMVLAGAQAASTDLVRFLCEAEAAAQLQHPNIVQVHEVGKHAGLPFISLEYVGGGTLAEKLTGTPLTPRDAAHLIETLARAVQYAHEHGVVHRDLKPANVLLTADGQPKVADFGLAKRTALGEGVTQTGVILGTPSYIAPEQAAGKKDVGPAADIYALGAILYELLTGRPPFKAPTPLDTFLHVITEEPVPPRRLQPRLPRDVDTICLKCLQKDPKKRYASAAALADDLGRYGSDRPIIARPVGLLERAWRWGRRNPWLAGLAAATVLLLLLLAGGASAAALWLKAANAEALVNLGRAEGAEQSLQEQLNRTREAEREKTDKLWQSYLDHARAGRWSGNIGRRFDSLDALAKAAEIRYSVELRNEAIACMTLADLRLSRRWDRAAKDDGADMSFDDALERYCRADKQGTIHVYAAEGDRLLLTLPASGGPDTSPQRQQGSVSQCLFSPGGRFLSARCEAGAMGESSHFIWDLAVGEVVARTPPAKLSWAIDFSLDGRRLAYALFDGTVVVCDLPSGKETHRLKGPTDPRCLRFHPDGGKLALAHHNLNTATIFDLERQQAVQTLDQPGEVFCLDWSPDGKRLAVGCSDFNGYLWQPDDTSRPPLVLKGSAAQLTSVYFNHRGDLLATAGWDGAGRLWDAATGKELVRFSAGGVFADRDVHGFSTDDRRLAVGEPGGSHALYEVATGREFRTLRGHERIGKGPWGVSLSADGLLVASSSGDGTRLWDLQDGRPVAFLPTGAGDVDRKLDRMNSTFAVFHPTENALLTSGSAGVLRWPIEPAAGPQTGRLRVGPAQQFPAKGATRRLALDPEARFLAVVQSDAVRLLDGRSGEQKAYLSPYRSVENVAISPDGRWAVAGSRRGSEGLRIWETETGRLAKVLTEDNGFAAFSPDGLWLATSSADQFHLLRTGSWEPGPTLGPRGAALSNCVAFAGRTRMLAAAHSNSVVHLIDYTTGELLARLDLPEPFLLTDLCFSSDGALLAAATENHAVYLWDLRRIFEQLTAMDLGEDLPAFPAAAAVRPAERLSVEVVPTPGTGPAKPPVVALLPSTAKRREATPEEIAGWVRQLADADAEIRDRAAKALQEVGPPALRDMSRAASDPNVAVRRAAKEVADRILVAEALAPRRVALKFQDASAGEAVKELSEKSGIRIEYVAPPPPAAPPPAFSLELDDTPFFEALDRMCEAVGLKCTTRDGQSFQCTPGTPSRRAALAYAGPFRLRGAVWTERRDFPLDDKAAAGKDTLQLQVAMIGEPQAAVVGVGYPRLVEARDDDDRNLVLTPQPTLPTSYEPYGAGPLVRPRVLFFQPASARGGTLKDVRGLLPLEVMIRREDIATASDLSKIEGKTVAGEGGVRLTVQRVQTSGRQLTVSFALETPQAWVYEPTTLSFELSDGKGRRFRASGVSVFPAAAAGRPPRPEELAVLSGAPEAGFPGGLAWAALAVAARGAERRWTGSAQWLLPEKPDPAALSLTFFRFERLRTELPFEFHDLPLP
jgi:WD40 repeat protein/tRNA A-37 threonylcarbamoyl transferase component Bud32